MKQQQQLLTKQEQILPGTQALGLDGERFPDGNTHAQMLCLLSIVRLHIVAKASARLLACCMALSSNRGYLLNKEGNCHNRNAMPHAFHERVCAYGHMHSSGLTVCPSHSIDSPANGSMIMLVHARNCSSRILPSWLIKALVLGWPSRSFCGAMATACTCRHDKPSLLSAEQMTR